MNELSRFDYGDLEPEVAEFARERAERIHELARLTASTIVEIGRNLTEVKERVGHGKFLDWIAREFAWNERTAQRFMSVYRNIKCDKLSDLEIDVAALYLIAAPKTPEPVRADLIRLAEAGEHVTHADARAAIDVARTRKTLSEYEAIIGKQLEEAVRVGRALIQIRDERLYRENYQTFEDYCHGRFGLRAEDLEFLDEIALVDLSL